MKGKNMKKTAVAVAILAFLGTAAPANITGALLTEKAITANAEGYEKDYSVSWDDNTHTAFFRGTFPEYSFNVSEFSEAQSRNIEHIIFLKDTVLPRDCQDMFRNFKTLKTVDFTEADFSKVENAANMFRGCTNLEKVIFTKTDFSSVQTFYCMFNECNSLTDIIDFKSSSSKLTTVESLFDKCYRLMNVDLSKVDTASVTNFSRMFMYCTNIRRLNLKGLNTSNATNISDMFNYCSSLITVDVSTFDTSNVTDMSGLFDNCFSLLSINLSNFETENCKDFSYLFSACNSLRDINICKFTISDDADVFCMFDNYIVDRITLGSGVKKIKKTMDLRSAPKGWVNEKNPDVIIANTGLDENAEFENNGTNTYIKNPAYGKIHGFSVTINENGTFGIRTIVELPDTLTDEEKASAYISCFPISGYCHSEEAIPIKRHESGYYYADLRICAKEMTARSSMKLYVNDEKIDEACFSIKQYADVIFSAPEKFPMEQDLVKAMLCVGGAAQRYFNCNTNSYQNADADWGINYSREETKTANNYVTPSDLDDLKYYGSSIILSSGIVQRHYFELTNGEIGDYTFVVDDKEIQPTQSATDPSLYYVDAKKNSALMKLYDASGIKAFKTSEPAKMIAFNYSVMDYVRIAKSQGVEGNELAVVKSLGWLADEAIDYFNNN